MEQPNKNKIMYFEFRKLVYSILSPACPQVFSSGGTCTLLPSLLGVHPNFWGCNVPSNSLHLGVQRKLTAFSPRKVVHHAVFCKYYAELAKTFFFCLTLGQTGSVVLSDPWPLCLSTIYL